MPLPACLPDRLPNPPGLRGPCSALSEEVVAGLLLPPPAPPAPDGGSVGAGKGKGGGEPSGDKRAAHPLKMYLCFAILFAISLPLLLFGGTREQANPTATAGDRMALRKSADREPGYVWKPRKTSYRSSRYCSGPTADPGHPRMAWARGRPGTVCGKINKMITYTHFAFHLLAQFKHCVPEQWSALYREKTSE